MLRILCVCLLAAAACRAEEGEQVKNERQRERVLYIYTWENYFSPEVVRDFEKAQSCRVDFDYFDSYDTMYERIRNGNTGYDIITPAASLAEQMDRQGLLMNLNRRLIPNMRHLDTTRLVPFPDLEMRYHAPYTWSINVIGYNRKKVSTEFVGSWGIYSQPGFDRRASMMNDPRYVVGAALKYLGYSLNSTKPDEIAEAGRILQTWKKSIAVLDVNQPRFELEKGHLDFIQAFSGDMALTAFEYPDLAFFVPREGSIINSDYFVIPVDAENHGLAHAFINHMFNPRMAARNMESVMYYMPNRAALAQLHPDYRNNPLLFFPKEDIDKSEAIRDIGDSLHLYDQVWEAFLNDGN